ncbi:MAG: hypothetical protein ACOC9Y_00100 [Chloroflexota bacterium]
MTTTPLNRGNTRFPALDRRGSTLPIVAIAGSRGKTTTSWMLQTILELDDAVPASWTSAGVYAGRDPIAGEISAWERVIRAVQFGEVDILLQELVAPVTLGVGLPRDTYPLAILTAVCGNDDACHNTAEARRERMAISVLREAMTSNGTLIANADDASILSCVDDVPVSSITLFALHSGNPALQNHLERGGNAIWIDDEWIVARIDRSSEVIMHVKDVAAALDGSLSFQIQNALAAIAAARHLEIEHETIRDALKAYLPDPVLQPGACNVLRVTDALVLVDAPEKLWSLRMVIRGMRHLAARRVIAVCGAFPRLTDDEAFEAARLVASIPGVVILHDNGVGGERIDTVMFGLRSSHVAPFVITMDDEAEAVMKLVEKLGPHDIGLVFADVAEDVLGLLNGG